MIGRGLKKSLPIVGNKSVSLRCFSSNSHKKVTLIPGDGIGPEISDSVVQIFSAANVPIKFEIAEIEPPTYEGGPVDLSKVIESFGKTKVALKGPLATPIGKGHTSLNLQLRKKFNLYANVRPCVSIPSIQTFYKGVDIVTIRENTEGEYSGLEHEVVDGVVQSVKVISEKASNRIVKYAFEYARKNNRKKITAVHKANIMRKSDGLFVRCAQKIAESYPDIQFECVNLDQAVYETVKEPSRYDVLVMPNLYGDIMSDLASGLIGGLGLTPSGNIGLDDYYMFEAVHGSAPLIAGKDLANPCAFIFSSVMMLRELGMEAYADKIYGAVMATLSKNVLTSDLKGTATCSKFTQEIINNLD